MCTPLYVMEETCCVISMKSLKKTLRAISTVFNCEVTVIRFWHSCDAMYVGMYLKFFCYGISFEHS
jgi:hypothetical protein